MRVLHLYSGNLYGGVERLLETFYRCREACADLRPAFGLCFDGLLADGLRRAGAEVHLLGPVRFREPWTVWQARRRLAGLLADDAVEPYDIAVTHACWPHAVFAPAVRSAKLPLANWVHDVPKGSHWSERWASRTPPDLAIANSLHTRSMVAKLFRGSASKVVHCAVAAPLIEPGARAEVRRELSTGVDEVVIFTAGRLERLKGQVVLLRALGRIRDVPGWTCWIAGGVQRPHEATYLDELQQLAASEGITSRVQFVGQRSDVSRLMAAADIYCQPNIGPEAFGIAFVEALYAGLPVVTSDLGGAPEVVDDTCGRLVPPGDVGGVAAALRALIVEPALRNRLGSAGPDRARELCDPGTVLRELHGHLISVATKRS